MHLNSVSFPFLSHNDMPARKMYPRVKEFLVWLMEQRASRQPTDESAESPTEEAPVTAAVAPPGEEVPGPLAEGEIYV